MVESTFPKNLKNTAKAWNRAREDNSWYATAQWCYLIDESNYCGKSLVYFENG